MKFAVLEVIKMPKLKYSFLYVMVIVLMLCSTKGHAQTYLGVKQGISLSQVNFSDVDPNYNVMINQQQLRGNLTGLALNVRQGKHTALQFELNLIDKGWQQLLDDNSTFTTELQYLNIYTQTHILIGKGKFKPFLTAGPYLNFLLNSKNSDIPADQEENIPFIFDESNDNKVDFGLGVGGGLSYDSKIGLFLLEGKFSLGLSNIIEKQLDTEPSFSQHQTIEISIQYFYPIRKKE